MTQEQEVAAIPLVEERVKIAKRQVESGRFRIHVSVEERQEDVAVDLASEEVEIERVPVNKAVTQVPSVRLEGTTTIIPVVEEVVVVEKRLFVVEEIHVRRKSTTETRSIPVTLKSEQVRIERSGDLETADAASSPVRTGDGA